MRFFRLNRLALLAIQSTSPCRRSRYTPVGMGARSAGALSARSLAWPSMSSCHIPAAGASFACIGGVVPVKPPLPNTFTLRGKRGGINCFFVLEIPPPKWEALERNWNWKVGRPGGEGR